MKRFTSLTIATLGLLTACTSTTATPATTTTIAPTTTSTTSTTIAPTTTLSPTTLAPVTTTKPKTTTTKPKTATTVAGGVNEARAGARAMLADLHGNFYENANIINLAAGFKQIEARYAAYAADAGTTITGYYLDMGGVKTCYAAHRDDPGMADTAC